MAEARIRPDFITCQGCGDPDVPCNPVGPFKRFCDKCNKNTNKALWNLHGADLQDARDRNRWAREHPNEPYPGEAKDAELPRSLRAKSAGPTEDPVDPHADEVAAAQDEARAYWAAQGAPVGDLEAPTGPITLNTPVSYDPSHDDLLHGFENEAVASADLVEHFEPAADPVVFVDQDDPDLVDHPDHSAPVCIAPGCALPDPGHGHDLFCHGHWRLVSLETRQRILGSPTGSARNGAVHRGLFEIRRALGG
jgi:hypothetical protein